MLNAQPIRQFHSYGPVDADLHYHAPRTALIDLGVRQLVGTEPYKGGHYITVWAPRQAGKSWIMLQVMQRTRAMGDFEVAMLTMQSAKNTETRQQVLALLSERLTGWFRRDFPTVDTMSDLWNLFTRDHFSKPLILIIDEFDAIQETYINEFASEFRDMYTRRLSETNQKSGDKEILLHGLALIGVRSVLGIENQIGSPFNVQRSFHVPNLTAAEVTEMFHWYERESGQAIEPAVIERIFYETQGQPGLIGWLGELLTETYNQGHPTITKRDFEFVYNTAVEALPNNNILNILSKAKQPAYKPLVLELFKTNHKIPFRYDQEITNFLYINGVIDQEADEDGKRFIKFPSPFVQKRLFNYFVFNIFDIVGQMYAPFEDLSAAITEDSLNLKYVLRHYEIYLQKNRHWLLKNAPRRTNLRIYEAVFHFSLYDSLVHPEFPTGNGQIDLLIEHAGQRYGLELKSYTNQPDYKKAIRQAGRYGQHLGLSKITLAFFIEQIDDANRKKYELAHQDQASGVTVNAVFVEIGPR